MSVPRTAREADRNLLGTAAAWAVLAQGVFCFGMGLLDLFLATGPGRRVLGFAFLLLGVIVLATVRPGRRSRVGSIPHFWGGVAALTGAGIILVALLRNVDGSLWVFFGAVVTGAASLYIIFNSWRNALWRPSDLAAGARGTLAVVSVATIISALQFTYSSLYSPLIEPANLTIKAVLEQGPSSGTLATVVADINIKNSGSSKVLILGSLYRAMAADVVEGPIDAPSEEELERLLVAHVPRPVRSEAEVSDWSVLGYGPVSSAGSWLEPEEELNTKQVFHVPTDRFSVVQVLVGLVLAQGDRLSIDAFVFPERTSPVRFDGVRGAVRIFPVQPMSLFERLTRGERLLFSGVITETPADAPDDWLLPPSLYTYIESPDHDPESGIWHLSDDTRRWDRYLSRQYGMAMTSSVVHIGVNPPTDDPPSRKATR